MEEGKSFGQEKVKAKYEDGDEDGNPFSKEKVKYEI